MDAGVSAYVVDGLKKERVKPILDMAISRFNAFARLTRELEDVWAESTGSQIHFTFWLMTGAALDSGDQPPCEENRGYSNH